MKDELFIYYKLNDEIRLLNDTYALCTGLLMTNPSKQNIASCNIVFKNIKLKVSQVKEECPYITFYTTYIK